MDRNNTNTTTSNEVPGMDAGQIFNKKHLEGEHIKVKDLFNEKLLLTALLFIKDGSKGDFAVLQVTNHETGREVTFSNGSHIVLEKLELLSIGVKADDFGVIRFPTPYRIRVVEKTSAKGKDYHDLESWS